MKDSLNKYIVILILFVTASCTKTGIGEIQNLNNGEIDIIGHGGSGFTSYTNPFPTNSLTSVRRALDGYGADGVEVDVQLSNDNILILYHDIALESLTDCDGCIRNNNSGDILQCNYDYDISFFKEPIIKLDRILDDYASVSNPPEIYLDLRSDNYCDPLITPYLSDLYDALISTINKYTATGFVHVISNNHTLLGMISTGLPGIELYYAAHDAKSGIDAAQANGYTGINIHTDRIAKKEISLAHALGIKVLLQGLTSNKKIKDALRKHPDAVLTDDIAQTISALY